jgi:hypothetical protein
MSQPGGDAANNIDKDQLIESNRSAKLEEDSNMLKRDAEVLTEIVYKNANPSPVVISITFIGIIIALWVFYVAVLKPNVSGEWRDSNGHKWFFDHNRMTGCVMVTIDNMFLRPCEITDNMFKCGSYLGVWNYRDVILFIDGGSLTRVRG